MSPDYGMELQRLMEMLGEALGGFLSAASFSTLVNIGLYILESLGVYTLAKHRCIGHAWLSWIPIANLWVLGSLSDQYRYVVKRTYTYRRRWLLILEFIVALLGAVLTILLLILLADIFHIAVQGESGIESFLLRWAMTNGTLCGVTLLALLIAMVWRLVLQFVALYDVYCSCDPANGTTFLVLSIFFDITRPFFLFFSRNKDMGMPPRREIPTAE